MSTFAYPPPALNTSNDQYESGHDSGKIPPQYISVAVLFGSFFILALLVVIVYVGIFLISRFRYPYTNRESGFRRAANANYNLDTERGHGRPSTYLGTFQDPARTRGLLDAASPLTIFKSLKDDSAGKTNKSDKKTALTPPNQRGTTVICVICLDDFKPKSAVRRLPCGHIFHATCIEEWLLTKHHFNCPLCNKCYLPDMPTIPSPTLASGGSGRDREDSQFVFVPL